MKKTRKIIVIGKSYIFLSLHYTRILHPYLIKPHGCNIISVPFSCVYDHSLPHSRLATGDVEGE
ncbi:unnamed protein product [Spirodela intermedia]|uniref:Uncharacterized protein n=1 Tax=Spirodela intermedia TaxID=51605 RepID=A0A7I8KS42_SPIIN|nr:unnamed protein product [Spirodela intermedia]